MNTHLLRTFAILCLPALASALPQAGKSTLEQARETFDAADQNKDGRLDRAELGAQRLAIGDREFATQDADRDGTWSRDEFVVYYRALLLRAGQSVGPELESEAARVLGLRRAREIEQAQRGAGRGNGPAAGRAEQQPGPVDPDARLERAIADLETKALARGATREDFTRVRSLWEARVEALRGDAPVDPGEVDVAARFTRALDALEKKAAAEGLSREDFGALRAAWSARARRASGGPAADPVANPLDSRFEQALADLERKAAARGASREDFHRVRNLWEERWKASGAADAAPTPDEVDLAARFRRAIDALEQRAATQGLGREEFTALRDAWVARARLAAAARTPAPDADPLEARFERALADLERKALARGASREDFVRVRSLWEERARAAQGGGAAEPGSVDLDARFQRALAALEQRALAGQVTRADFEALRAMWIARARRAAGTDVPAAAEASIETRFERALADLEAKAVARQATREDWQRVKDLLAARARHAVFSNASPAGGGDGAATALADQLASALARLEQRAAGGELTRGEFQSLRDMLITRARQAVPETPGGEPGVRARGGAEATTSPPADGARPAPETPAPAPGVRARRAPPKEKADEKPAPEHNPPQPAPEPKPVDPPKEREGRPGRPPQ